MKVKVKAWKIMSLSVIAAICLLCCIPALLARAAADGVTVSGESDAFVMTETEYGKTDAFVFDATAKFSRGNAAGLVFGANDNGKWVFNVDRSTNLVKLMYFDENGVEVLKQEPFIGNDKMTESEHLLVDPKVATVDKVQLKVVVTPDPENDSTVAEFYADNIIRFGFDERGNDVVTDLDKLNDGISYEGGLLGYNCYNADVTFSDVHIGASDYAYYTEMYRQQYHFSQYAHWNNDPNGLVYYNGYYHIFYQHYPYANNWGDMYWGHARSRDLVHWQHLPICLYPDRGDEWGGGDGFMWSGSARVYHRGDSATIDGMNWYPNGDGSGLIAFYTRDGARQDQMIMSSDDGGITWTKRKCIDQEIVTGNVGKTDCRDPKVFEVPTTDGGKVWGMVVTGMGSNNIWFMKSDDMYNWTSAGGFKAYKPECPDVIYLDDEDGEKLAVMTFTSRQYLVGKMSYDSASGKIVFSDMNGVDYASKNIENIEFMTMDFGPDSYASQTFYIDDDSDSEYAGHSLLINWFSGVPGAPASVDSGMFAEVRKVWNGGGMTIPVDLGLVKNGSSYILTQTPIVKTSSAFAELKTNIYSGENVAISADGENVLENVNSHIIEIDASIDNPTGASLSFKIAMRGDEYTEIGWNAEDGYYVDRTHSGDGGLTAGNYKARFTSGATSGTTQTFYILSDNGGVEVFCDGFEIPFYVLTLSSPYATAAEFNASGAVTANMTVNAIASAWQKENTDDKSILILDCESMELDTVFTREREIMAFSPTGGDIEWNVVSGDGVVSVEKTETGATVKAVAVGTASIEVICGDAKKTVSVTVYGGSAESDLRFDDSALSGRWHMTANGILGVQSGSDGFMISSNEVDDFTLASEFALDGAAAALVFRAKPDMSDYLIANYDRNGKIVKLWSPRGEIANVRVDGIDEKNILLKITANGNNVKVSINGREVIDTDLGEDEPMSGYLGLNVCAGRVTFKSLLLLTYEYDYADGALSVRMESTGYVTELINRTLGNVKVPKDFYTQSGRTLTLSSDYFATLKAAGTNEFTAVSDGGSYTFKVNVSSVPKANIEDFSVEFGCNAAVFVGNASGDVKLNGETLSSENYKLDNGVLTLYASALVKGENIIEIDGITFTLTVNSQSTVDVERKSEGLSAGAIAGITVPVAIVVLAGIGAGVFFILKSKGIIKLKSKTATGSDNAPDGAEAEKTAEEKENGDND